MPVPNPPTIVTLSADWWSARNGQPIVAIIAHGTGGTNSIDTLRYGGGRKVSAHVLITKIGAIFRFVPDARGANHAGANSSSFTLGGKTYRASAVNRATLSFELENLQDGKDPYTDPQLLSMGWQIGQWRIAYDPLPILRHAGLDPTRRKDPVGLDVEDIERWVRRAVDVFVPAPKTYRITGVPVYQRQDLTGPIADHIPSGVQLDIDQTYPNGAGHLVSGLGFIDMDALEPV